MTALNRDTSPPRHRGTQQRPAGCCTPACLAPLDADMVSAAVRRLRALADPTRLTILATLAASAGPVCACDLGGGADLEQPTISHHLKVLREAGLVTSERRGTWGFYQLRPTTEAWVRAALAGLPG